MAARGRTAVVLALLAVCAAQAAACGGGHEHDGDATAAGGSASGGEAVLTPESVGDAAKAREGTARTDEDGAGRQTRARVVELRGAGAKPRVDGPASTADAISPGAPSDAEVRAELRQARAQLSRFKRFLGTTAFLQTGPRARVLPDGTAVAPDDAPEPVKRVIQAGNTIAKFPYKWGGGHGAWRDNGYDCSGSVSFALAGAGLLGAPLTSGGFMDWGAAGTGDWITIYTNPGHIFMIVAGLRFDTSGQGRAGTRWQEEPRSTAGFVVRSVPGL